LGIIGFAWTVALIITPYLGMHLDWIEPLIQDQNFKNQLATAIQWNLFASSFGVVFGILFFYGLWALYRNQIQKGAIIVFASCLFGIQVLSMYYLPRIEQLVQGSVIEFLEGLRGKDVNTQALFIKSYNQYFYSNRMPFQNREDTLKHLYYLYFPIERDCYFILRTIDRIKLDTTLGPNTKFLYEKSGFSFYQRIRN
jgi:hypothetical protein